MIQLQGTFLKHKIARQLFYLFILAALVPISLLALISYKETQKTTIEQLQDDLRQDAKKFGMLLYERLLLADQQLQLHINENATQNITKTRNLSSGFTHLFLVDNNNVNNFEVIGNSTSPIVAPPLLTDEQRAHLLAGKPLIFTQHSHLQKPHIYLARAISNTSTIFIGLMKTDFLWGEIDSFDHNKPFCLFAENNQSLFCSNSELADKLGTTIKNWKGTTTGSTSFKTDDSKIYIGFWTLFLKPTFHYPQITISITANEKLAHKPIIELRETFLVISLLIIIIALLSTVKIRKYLSPLDELLVGISRISRNDFSQRILIESNNEFSQLADSFNTMSLKLDQQFTFLTALSEIDQLILSSSSLKGIVKNTITLAGSAVNSESVCIGILRSTDTMMIDIYYADNHNSSPRSHTIQPDELAIFNHHKVIHVSPEDSNQHTFKAYLNHPNSNGNKFYHSLVPIQKNGVFSAVLIFKFLTKKNTTDTRLREFGNRLTIALEKIEWETQLYHKAHHDPLTQLPNRQLLNDRLAQTLKLSAREKSSFSLLFIDLDRFKTINDSLGHTAGDTLLKLVSQKLNDTVRNIETVARLGGDEFVILVAPEKTVQESSSSASALAHNILSALSLPFTVMDEQVPREIHISASIGIAIYPADGKQCDSLLKNADSAMYSAKSKGRNNVQFYSEKLNQTALNTLMMETELHKALANNELELYYQPKVNCHTGEILGAEALIRWNHPIKGLISPIEFIPLAEENGLIRKIGQWTLLEACRQNKEWQRIGLNKIIVSVNLSPKQFHQQNLFHLLEESIEKTQLAPQYLDLEIVESTAMENINETIKTITRFKEFGISVSIDDYGVGFSTLHYIKMFPVNVLKIDREFIINLVSDSGDQAIVTSTILLAHKLGLSVVAEGVEDAEQLALLQQYGCDEIQGYYFSPPVPAAEFEVFLRQESFKLD